MPYTILEPAPQYGLKRPSLVYYYIKKIPSSLGPLNTSHEYKQLDFVPIIDAVCGADEMIEARSDIPTFVGRYIKGATSKKGAARGNINYKVFDCNGASNSPANTAISLDCGRASITPLDLSISIGHRENMSNIWSAVIVR